MQQLALQVRLTESRRSARLFRDAKRSFSDDISVIRVMVMAMAR